MSERTTRERMERAIRAVRREGRRAAAVHAVAEATAALLATNLALTVAGDALPDAVDAPVALPARVTAAGGPESVDAGVFVALGVAVVVFLVGFLVRVRRPLVERFEAVNPPVSEALRTARDAVRADREGPMADRLYGSVLTRLGECSSLGLVSVRRLAVVLVLVALLGAANVQVAVVGFEVGGGGQAPDASTGGSSSVDDEYGGLNDPDQVLGEPEDVSSGSEEVNATLPTRGDGNGSASESDSYGTGGYAAGTDVESQQAGFAESERLEDAELIREYNLRIREDEDG